MEFGAIFILVVVAIVLAVLGGLVLAVASALRRGKLHPEGDKVEGAGEAHEQQEHRPRHRRVGGAQRARFIAHR